MAVNKNFVVKNGLEVNQNLIFANANTNKVGIATTVPGYELDIAGGIGVTNAYVSGITTVINEFRVGTSGTVFTVIAGLPGAAGAGVSVGVGNSTPEYLLDVRSPVSTGQTALYVYGDMRVTGDINLDDITLDDATIDNLSVTDTLIVVGLSTFSGDVDINANLDAALQTTLNHLNVTGVSSLADGSESVPSLTFVSDSDTGLFWIRDNQISAAAGGNEIVSIGVDGVGIGTTNISTAADSNNTSILNAGIVTANYFYGDGSFLENVVRGVGIATTDASNNAYVIGYGATVITFAGPGVSTVIPPTVSSGIATVYFQGGGGSGGFQTLILRESFPVSTASTDIFDLNSNYVSGYLNVYLNGVKLNESDFVETDANTITLNTPAKLGDIVETENFQVTAITGEFETRIVKEEFTVGAAGTDMFSLANTYNSGYIDVYLNGTRLTSTDYTETDTTTITLSSDAVEGDVVEFVNYERRTISSVPVLWEKINGVGINTTEKVGIATTTPTSQLHVVGDALVTGIVTATTFAGLATHATRLETSRDFSISGDVITQTIPFDGTSNVGFAVTLSNSFSANTSGIITAATFSGDVYASNTQTIQVAEIFGFSPVIINTTGIQALTGIITANSFVKEGGSSSEFLKADGTVDSSTYLTSESDTLDSVTGRGNSTSNGISVGILTATDINSTSDASLKENVTTVSNALDTTQQLRGVRFEWKRDGKPSYGVIAQELEQILPELVSDTDPKTVNYNGIIGVLIEAVKELTQRVEDLENKSR